MWSWSSLQDVKPSGKWEKIPFHTAADASAQMFLNWATFFRGKRFTKQFSCHYYCHNRSSVHEIFRDSKYLHSPIHYNSDYRLYTGTASQACVYASYSSQSAFPYGFFFARWHLHTISSLDAFCKRGGAFSAGNSQHDWGFNVGEASAQPVKVCRPEAI